MNLVETPLLPLPREVEAATADWHLPLWLADVQLLIKPRISVMVLLTVAAGFIVSASSPIPWLLLFHTLVGTTGVACAASILNQVLERRTDALMQRTRERPIAAGRLGAGTATRLGLVLGGLGLRYLAATTNLLTVAVAGATLAIYVLVYTPLKTQTAWNTEVGAVPGALPPLIGAAAAAHTLTEGALALFAIIFLWQFPHFWAIAWMYREDYARGGLVMLPHADQAGGGLTGRLMFKTSLWLILASLVPTMEGAAGWIYLATALLAGVGFAASTVVFWLRPTVDHARLVLRLSLVYLPTVLLLMLLDGPLRWRL